MIFFFVGQIEEHKGIILLIECFKELCKQKSYKKIKLTIIGNGSKFKKAKNLALNCNIIEFTGKKSREQVFEFMKKSDCLIMPSLCYENSPTVIYEAINSGLPVLASRLGGITELIHGFGGILFKPASKDNLMLKMKWVIRNKDKLFEIQKKAIKKIRFHNPELYIDKLIELSY